MHPLPVCTSPIIPVSELCYLPLHRVQVIVVPGWVGGDQQLVSHIIKFKGKPVLSQSAGVQDIAGPPLINLYSYFVPACPAQLQSADRTLIKAHLTQFTPEKIRSTLPPPIQIISI